MNIMTEYDEEKQLRYAFRDGKAEGKAEQLISLICRKLKKGKTMEQIAEDLDEDISVIRPYYKAALPYAPDFDSKKVFQSLYPKVEDMDSYFF